MLKSLIKKGEKAGYITYSELNEVLPKNASEDLLEEAIAIFDDRDILLKEEDEEDDDANKKKKNSDDEDEDGDEFEEDDEGISYNCYLEKDNMDVFCFREHVGRVDSKYGEFTENFRKDEMKIEYLR